MLYFIKILFHKIKKLTFIQRGKKDTLNYTINCRIIIILSLMCCVLFFILHEDFCLDLHESFVCISRKKTRPTFISMI